MPGCLIVLSSGIGAAAGWLGPVMPYDDGEPLQPAVVTATIKATARIMVHLVACVGMMIVAAVHGAPEPPVEAPAPQAGVPRRVRPALVDGWPVAAACGSAAVGAVLHAQLAAEVQRASDG